jgi:hypothetical protein
VSAREGQATHEQQADRRINRTTGSARAAHAH